MITNKDVSYDPKTDTLTINGVRNQIAGAAEVETLAGDVGDLRALTTTDKSNCVGAINELKSGLTNIDYELEDFRKRYTGGDLWPGDTLVFNVSTASNVIYYFIACDTTAEGTPESAYLLVKSTGVQVYDKVGRFTTAYDADYKTLTITLPSSSYWDYRFEVAAMRNG